MPQNKNEEHILYLVNAKGHCSSVQISLELWELVQAQVEKAAKKLTNVVDPFDLPQPLDSLEELKTYWDFTYPYEPHVHCDACGATSDDWENDPAHPFHLTNANFGGLMVFLCRCGATVRKKHFHRKVVFECTPKS